MGLSQNWEGKEGPKGTHSPGAGLSPFLALSVPRAQPHTHNWAPMACKKPLLAENDTQTPRGLGTCSGLEPTSCPGPQWATTTSESPGSHPENTEAAPDPRRGKQTVPGLKPP